MAGRCLVPPVFRFRFTGKLGARRVRVKRGGGGDSSAVAANTIGDRPRHPRAEADGHLGVGPYVAGAQLGPQLETGRKGRVYELADSPGGCAGNAWALPPYAPWDMKGALRPAPELKLIKKNGKLSVFAPILSRSARDTTVQHVQTWQ